MQHHVYIYMFLSTLKCIESYTFQNKRTSYIQYEQWDAKTVGLLTFKFKTFNPYGLLLYSDNSKATNSIESFLAVKLSYGKIELTVQMGSEDYKSRKTKTIGNHLNDLQWHTVEIRRIGRETKLILDNKPAVALINDGEHKTLELNSGLYFGGVSEQLATNLVDRTITALPRFIGCIEDIKYKSGSSSQSTTSMIEKDKLSTAKTVTLSQSVDKVIAAVDVTQGCLDACANFTCPNDGRCVNMFTMAKCNCIGTGYFGSNCTKEADSLQFKGKEYITVSVAGPKKSTSTNNIVLRFKTRESDGIILAAWSGNDHLMLELHQTIIRFSMDLGGGFHILEVNNIVFSDGEWHVVEIVRNGRDLALTVDKKYNVNSSTGGVFSKFDLRDYLFVGGHEKLKTLAKINSKSQRNFVGCIQQLYYNGLDVVYKVINTRSTRFKMYGAVKKGCTVTKPKNKTPREVVSNVSKSGSGTNHKNDNGDSNPTHPPKKKPAKINSDDSTLSKKTVIWIASGLIVGFIVLIVTLALIVHNVRNRYSGVFLSSALKNKDNNNSKKPLHHRPETVYYTPRRNNIYIEPHLV